MACCVRQPERMDDKSFPVDLQGTLQGKGPPELLGNNPAIHLEVIAANITTALNLHLIKNLRRPAAVDCIQRQVGALQYGLPAQVIQHLTELTLQACFLRC